LVPDTSPFSKVTASRYWMAGLVACGMIMLLYIFANWVMGRRSKRYYPPAWKRVWVIAAALLSIGLPAITMGVNDPRLPAFLAVLVTVATLVSLALSLMPGALAARQPKRLLWLFLDGWGVALLLWTLHHMADIEEWMDMGAKWRIALAIIILLAGCCWLILLSFIQVWRRKMFEGTVNLFLAGLCVAYLLIPLLHYVLFSDDYRYITNSDNFFARNLGIQFLAWLLVVLIVWGIRRFRLYLAMKCSSDPVEVVLAE